MGEIIKFMPAKKLSAESVEMFRSLSGKLDEFERDIQENPLHHLNNAAKRIFDLEATVEKAILALSGLDESFYMPISGPLEAESIASVTMARNKKARDMLKKLLVVKDNSDE